MDKVLSAILFFAASSAGAQETDIINHIAAGGLIGQRASVANQSAPNAEVKFKAPLPDNGTARSKGIYKIGKIIVGEIVVRISGGNIIEEYIDIPLLTAADMPENKGATTASPSPQPGTVSQHELETLLTGVLGQEISNYGVAGNNGASSKDVTLWRLKGQSKNISARLELFYSDDNKFLTNTNPHFARILIQFIPDLESVLFDPSIFLLKHHQLIEKLALVGLNVRNDLTARVKPKVGSPTTRSTTASGRTQNTQVSAKILGAEAIIKVNASLDRLQSIQVQFNEMIPTQSLVMNKYGDQFVNVAKSVISDKLRSYPTELTRTNVTYSTKDYLLYDPASDQYYKYTDVLQFRNQEVKLVWSPGRGRANYRLEGRTFEILPPGLAVLKAIDPTFGTLTAGDLYNSSMTGDFNLPVLSFADYQKNLLKTPIGIWLDLPMENQGELPFCLPASMARIMRYFGRQVNQFTVAQVGGVGMRGTNWSQMVTIIDTLCDKLNFKLRKLDRKQNLGVFVKDSIDKGLPVLWLIPDHARIINGYDARTQSILYTDSWGGGFEVRSMPYAEAVELTQFAITFLPPGAIK